MNRSLIVVVVLLLLAAYLVTLGWTGRAFVAYVSASSKLSLDERPPVTVAADEQVTLDIAGSGFSDDTRAFLHMDVNNQDAIVGSFPIDEVIFDMERVGNTLFLAGIGHGVRGFDVSDPLKPKMLPNSYLKYNSVLDIERSGDRLYFSCGNQGVKISQIKDSGRLGVAESLHTRSPAFASKVIGRYLYVAAGKDGLLIYDLDNLDEKQPLLALGNGQSMRGLQVYNDYLYLNGGKSGIHIYRHNDSGVPQPVGVALVNHPTRKMLVADESLYVLANSMISQYELSDPANPQLVAEQQHFSLPLKLYHAGDTIYVADNASGVGLINNRNKRLPSTAGFLQVGGDARAFEMIGGYLYIAVSKVGIKIIDPAAILPRQTVQTFNTPRVVKDFKIIGNSLYVADDVKGLFLKKLSGQGGTLRKIHSQRVHSLAHVGAYLFAVSPYSGLLVFDVSDPAKPKLLKEWPALKGAALAANGKYLVLGRIKNRGFTVLDISDLEQPLVLAETTGHFVSNAYLMDDLVVIAGGGEGLSIYRIEKNGLVLKGQSKLPYPLDTFAESRSLQVVNNIAFVANGAAGLKIVDISNPSTPEVLGTLSLPGFSNSVLVEDKYVYVTNRYSGLNLVDISDLGSPRLLSTIDISDLSGGAQRFGDLLFLGNRYMGVAAIPFPEEIKNVRLLSEDKLQLSVPAPKISGRYSLQVSSKEETAALDGVLRFQ